MQKRNIKPRSKASLQRGRQIKKELRNQKALIQCAERFNVVGDLTRLKVCYLLCHYEGLSVGDIADTIGVSISAVSHTLKKLQEAGIVESRRVYRNVYYQLKKSPFTNIIKGQFKYYEYENI